MADDQIPNDHAAADDSLHDDTQFAEWPKGPTFLAPMPYGVAAAIETMTTIAAPLLAGGGLALIGVVIQQQNSFRYPGATILFLVLSVILLISAVQFGFWARQFSVTPAEIAQWHPTMPPEARWQLVRREQYRIYIAYAAWAGRARICFNFAITFVWICIAIAVLPQDGDKEPALRVIASICAALVGLVELVSIYLIRLDSVKRRLNGNIPPMRRIPREIWPWTVSNDPFTPR